MVDPKRVRASEFQASSYPEPECNYLDITAHNLALQEWTLSRDAVWIVPYDPGRDLYHEMQSFGDVKGYCWYAIGNHFLSPVIFQEIPECRQSRQTEEEGAEDKECPPKPVETAEFSGAFLVIDGRFARSSASYLVFPKGRPEKMPEEFAADADTHPDAETIMFGIVDREVDVMATDVAGTKLLIESAIRGKILAKLKIRFPDKSERELKDKIINVAVRLDGREDSHRVFTVFVIGYDLPQMTGRDLDHDMPELTMETCPEYVFHRRKLADAADLTGWIVAKKGDGKYVAVPDEGLQGDIQERASLTVDREALYHEDLRTRLGMGQFLNGDDPVRLLRSITSIGTGVFDYDGCLAYLLDIIEVRRGERGYCVARLEGKTKDELGLDGRVFTIEGGDIVEESPDLFRYITDGKRHLGKAKEFVLHQASERVGYKIVVAVKRLRSDRYCREYELRIAYQKIEPDEGTPLVPTRRPEGDDRDFLIERYAGRPEIQEKVRLLGELGEIHLTTDGGGGIIAQLRRFIQLEERVERYETGLIVDNSGSMNEQSDMKLVSGQFWLLEGDLRNSTVDGDADMMLGRFVNDINEIVVPLQPGRPLDETVNRVGHELRILLKKADGGLEYIFEAADKALDEFERDGVPGARRRLIIITDEDGDVRQGQIKEEEAARIHKRAAKLGVEFKIMFIADNSYNGRLLSRDVLSGAVYKFVTDSRCVDGSCLMLAREKKITILREIVNDKSIQSVARYVALMHLVPYLTPSEAIGLLDGLIAETGGSLYKEALELLSQEILMVIRGDEALLRIGRGIGEEWPLIFRRHLGDREAEEITDGFLYTGTFAEYLPTAEWYRNYSFSEKMSLSSIFEVLRAGKPLSWPELYDIKRSGNREMIELLRSKGEELTMFGLMSMHKTIKEKVLDLKDEYRLLWLGFTRCLLGDRDAVFAVRNYLDWTFANRLPGDITGNGIGNIRERRLITFITSALASYAITGEEEKKYSLEKLVQLLDMASESLESTEDEIADILALMIELDPDFTRRYLTKKLMVKARDRFMLDDKDMGVSFEFQREQSVYALLVTALGRVGRPEDIKVIVPFLGDIKTANRAIMDIEARYGGMWDR